MKMNTCGTPGLSGWHSGDTKALLIRNRLSLFVLAVLSVTPAALHAQFTYTTNNATVTITRYNGPGGAVLIPDRVDGLPVTGIGEEAFWGNSDVTSVAIPGSVTIIEDGHYESQPYNNQGF
jgi:hypothetical protein